MIAMGGLAFAGKHAEGDHIDGHDDDDPVFPTVLPDRDVYRGGPAIMHLIGPRENYRITRTRFDIAWATDGLTSAADIVFTFGTQVNGNYATFTVTGADLGFGDGPGLWHGTLETDALNGETWRYPWYEFSIVDLQIDAEGTGWNGGTSFFVDSWIYFDVEASPPLTLSVGGSCGAGEPMVLAWEHATPNTRLALAHADAEGSVTVPFSGSCPGVTLGLARASVRVVAVMRSGPIGRGERQVVIDPGACAGVLQMLESPTCEPSNVVRLQ